MIFKEIFITHFINNYVTYLNYQEFAKQVCLHLKKKKENTKWILCKILKSLNRWKPYIYEWNKTYQPIPTTFVKSSLNSVPEWFVRGRRGTVGRILQPPSEPPPPLGSWTSSEVYNRKHYLTAIMISKGSYTIWVTGSSCNLRRFLHNLCSWQS